MLFLKFERLAEWWWEHGFGGVKCEWERIHSIYTVGMYEILKDLIETYYNIFSIKYYWGSESKTIHKDHYSFSTIKRGEWVAKLYLTHMVKLNKLFFKRLIYPTNGKTCVMLFAKCFSCDFKQIVICQPISRW